jgi:hypothetical protein
MYTRAPSFPKLEVPEKHKAGMHQQSEHKHVVQHSLWCGNLKHNAPSAKVGTFLLRMSKSFMFVQQARKCIMMVSNVNSQKLLEAAAEIH